VILLWGLLEDAPLATVHEALGELGAPVVHVDQAAVLSSRVELHVDGDVRGRLRTPDREVDLADVRAAYFRPYDTLRLGAIERAGRGSDEWARALAFDGALWLWADEAPALVVNRPRAMASNNSKPFQSRLIREAGFDVPDTLITTDPAAALAFWQRWHKVVYKSVSGVRSIVSCLRDEHRPRLDQVRWCPTQFQQYVTGTDHRVHVVGDEVFCCAIHTQADDYRYAERHGAAVEMETVRLPPECADRCRVLAQDLGLPVAGIDLRLTADGAWYCFEVNPSPAFSFFDREPGEPIGAAVARLLAGAMSPG
jgi:hypothetical protein